MSETEFGAMAIPADVVHTIQAGAMRWSYRGRSTWKCPFDLALYLDLIWQLRPRSIVELGSHRGGSALWFADTLTTYGLDAHVYSYDIEPVTDLPDPRITFGYCDVGAIDQHLSLAELRSLPKPLLVVDDATHRGPHVLATLRFMDRVQSAGDYLIVEDGALTTMGWRDQYDGGPLAALAPFLAECEGRYEVDRARCDYYGRNVTWNPEGYLRRVRD